MEYNSEPEKMKKPAGPADHLANERTFLAWIRTSIALMGFGFVIVKFALFIRQMGLVLGERANISVNTGRGYSAVIGVVMVIVGAVMAVLAFLRYRSIERQLKKDVFFPSQWLTIAVTISIIIGSVLLVIYLLPNI
jgi:putative membrane protein